MVYKKRITHEYESTRQIPKNLKDEHTYLFSNEFRKTIEETHVKETNNVTISDSLLYKYKFISLNPRYFKMDTEKWNLTQISLKEFIKYFTNFKKYQRIEKASWVIDDKSFNYFHWMTDVLSRIEMLKEFDLKEYPILLPAQFMQYSFIVETLQLLDIPHIFYEQKKKYIINKLLLTTHAADAGNYNNFLINRVKKKLIEVAKSNFEENSPKKIWLSRTGQDRRIVNNEEKITEFLNKEGFNVINPENYSIVEQVNIFSNADIVIAPHGAALTNIMFMKKNSKVMEIRIFSDSVRNAFFSLSSEFALSYYYFLAEAKSENLVEDLNINMEDFLEEYSKFKKGSN